MTAKPDTTALTPPKYTTTFDDISMEGDRAQRFMQTLLGVFDICESLRTASTSFPHQIPTTGQMAPRHTVEAFGLLLGSRLDLLMSMASSEDHIDFPKLTAWERAR